MSSDDNKDAEEFEGTDAGCALTEPIRAGEVKKGMVVMLKGHPCKVIDISVSKPGKHGHAKGKITGTDIFTALKYIDISPMAHNMTKPIVKVRTQTPTHMPTHRLSHWRQCRRRRRRRRHRH